LDQASPYHRITVSPYPHILSNILKIKLSILPISPVMWPRSELSTSGARIYNIISDICCPLLAISRAQEKRRNETEIHFVKPQWSTTKKHLIQVCWQNFSLQLEIC